MVIFTPFLERFAYFTLHVYGRQSCDQRFLRSIRATIRYSRIYCNVDPHTSAKKNQTDHTTFKNFTPLYRSLTLGRDIYSHYSVRQKQKTSQISIPIYSTQKEFFKTPLYRVHTLFFQVRSKETNPPSAPPSQQTHAKTVFDLDLRKTLTVLRCRLYLRTR